MRACRAAGIGSTSELLKFDHRQFWKDRLLLYEVDAEKLGRMVRNKRDGTRSRSANIEYDKRMRREVNLDLKAGESFPSVNIVRAGTNRQNGSVYGMGDKGSSCITAYSK